MTRLFDPLRIMTQSVRSIGFWPTLAYIPRYLRDVSAEHWEGFDRIHGTHTSDRNPDKSQINHGHWPTPTKVFHHLMSHLAIRHENFTFVDVGSGMGRVLLLASDYPFKRIVGVERSAALAETCRTNVAVYRSHRQRCHQFEVHAVDATEFSIPTGPLMLYFFRPFKADVLTRFLANLEASWIASPRKMFVLDYNPWPDGPCDQAPFLKRIARGNNAGAYRLGWAIHSSNGSVLP